MGDLHRILQIRPGADDETVAAAYARLRRRYDPALGGPFADEAALREVERAYAILSDPEARDAYEMTGRTEGAGFEDGAARPGGVVTPAPARPAARDPFGIDRHPENVGPVAAEELPQFKPDAQKSSAKVESLSETKADIWRAGTPPAAAPAPSSVAPSDAPAQEAITHSVAKPPLRERVTDARSKTRMTPPWRGGYTGIVAAVLVVLGGGLAAWGILQAVGGADDESSRPEAQDPAVETTSEGDEAAPATLEAPEVSSAEALPEELSDFGREAVVDFEADDGTRYRVYDFVATTADDGTVFYAAMAIRAESDLVGQAVFFFAGDSLLGRDWGEDVRSVESIASLSDGRISVVYQLYAADDEDCCPSGEPFAVVYSYDGEFRADNATPPDGIFLD